MGDSENDQIFRMFSILGTPNQTMWPGVDNFPNFKDMLVPDHPKIPLKELFPNLPLDDAGFDLMERMLVYDPTKRITAKSALDHPYFHELS